MKKYTRTIIEHVEAVQFDGNVPPDVDGQPTSTVRLSGDGMPFINTVSGPLFLNTGDFIVYKGSDISIVPESEFLDNYKEVAEETKEALVEAAGVEA